ncbi:MAG: transporter substrate-binding domain-containing protein [Pseudomonadota bacterium]
MQRRTLLKLSCLTCLPITSAQSQEINTMQISTLLETDPATTIAERVVQEAYRRLGMKMVLSKVPGERSLFSVDHGQADGELYRKLGMERDYPNLRIVPVPLLTYEIVVFTMGTGFVINGWESLRPFTIGFVKGIKIIEQNTQDMKLEPTATMRQAFLKMTLRRSDIVVANRSSGLAVLKEMKLPDVKIMEPPLATFPVFHYLHKKHEELVPKLTKVLQQMQKDKTIENIQKAVMAEQSSGG